LFVNCKHWYSLYNYIIILFEFVKVTFLKVLQSLIVWIIFKFKQILGKWLKTVFKTTFMVFRFLKVRSLFWRLKLRYIFIYLNGDLYIDGKKIWKLLLFSNLGIVDTAVDGFFSTTFTFSEFCGGRISKRTSNHRILHRWHTKLFK